VKPIATLSVIRMENKMSNVDFMKKVRHHKLDGYFIQGMDSCCFIYAAANLAVYLGRRVPPLKPIIEETNAWNGGVIGAKKVVEYFGLKLKPTESHRQTLKKGGILSIWHPCCNGHCCFVAPIDAPSISDFAVFAVNSFLGPPIEKTPARYLEKFSSTRLKTKLGGHWMAFGDDAARLDKLRGRQ